MWHRHKIWKKWLQCYLDATNVSGIKKMTKIWIVLIKYKNMNNIT